MKTQQERIKFKTLELQIKAARDTWNAMLPRYNRICALLVENGLEVTSRTLHDLIYNGGKRTLEAIAEMATDQARKTGITDPSILAMLAGNPVERLKPIMHEVEMVQYHVESSFVHNFKRAAFSSDYLSVKNNRVSLSDQTFKEITDQFFVVWVDSPRQLKVYKLAEKILPDLNAIFDEVYQFDPSITLEHGVFELDENDQFKLSYRALQLLKD